MSRTVVSAGLLVYRRGARRRELEVLLAHPGGPYWAKKDDGAWTVPKGLVEGDEDLLTAARREFGEETGLPAAGDVIALKPVNQRSGKLVHAFALEADIDLTGFSSNTFEMEWPPRSGRRRNFPEIDRVAYFPLADAMVKILAYQRPLLRELEQRVG